MTPRRFLPLASALFAQAAFAQSAVLQRRPVTRVDSSRITASVSQTSSADSTEPIYRFATDYDIPESPGFAILGVTPSNVLRGSAAKPVVATLLTQAISSQKLQSGIALDFAPYFAFGGTVRSINQYSSHGFLHALANLALSFASIQSPEDTGSVAFGLGARVSFYDPHDLLAHSSLVKIVTSALPNCAEAPPSAAAVRTGREEEIGKPRHCAALADAYKLAKDSVLGMSGFSLAIGAGAGGLLHGSVISQDSLGARRGRIWVSSGYSFARKAELLAIASMQDSTNTGWSAKGGVGARGKFPSSEFGVEISYDGAAKTWQPGGSGEFRLTDGVWLVASLAADNLVVAGKSVQKIRFRTAFRWNAAARN